MVYPKKCRIVLLVFRRKERLLSELVRSWKTLETRNIFKDASISIERRFSTFHVFHLPVILYVFKREKSIVLPYENQSFSFNVEMLLYEGTNR
jgi:hypothetical protein